MDQVHGHTELRLIELRACASDIGELPDLTQICLLQIRTGEHLASLCARNKA